MVVNVRWDFADFGKPKSLYKFKSGNDITSERKSVRKRELKSEASHLGVG